MTRRFEKQCPSWGATGCFVLFSVYWILGFATNFYRTHSALDLSSQLAISVSITLFIVLAAGMVSWSVLSSHVSLSRWGLTIGKRWWLSVGLVVVSVVLVSLNSNIVFVAFGQNLVLKTVGASLEEVFFRGLLISTIIGLTKRRRLGWTLAIVASSLSFTLAHIVTKNPMELQGIFVSSLVFGLIVLATRSVLFPIFYHVLSNTAGDSGLLGGILAVALFLVIAMVGRLWDNPEEPGSLCAHDSSFSNRPEAFKGED